MKDISRFSWHRYSLGYQFVEGQRTRDTIETELVLVPLHGAPEGTYLSFDPAEQGALFRVFALTTPDAAGVVGFANRYGPLGVEQPYHLLFVGDEVLGGAGEPLAVWKDEIAAMRQAVDLWEAIPYSHWGRQRQADLARFIPSLPPPRVSPLVDQPPPPDRHEAMLGQLYDATEHGRWREMAELLLHFAVNDELGRWTAAEVLPASPTRPRNRAIVPKNLLGVMWLQFANAATGKAVIRPCEGPGCGGYVTISREPGGHTQRKKHCSVRCRVRAGDHRKAWARQLVKEGATPAEAARQVGSTAKIVRGWVKRRRS